MINFLKKKKQMTLAFAFSVEDELFFLRLISEEIKLIFQDVRTAFDWNLFHGVNFRTREMTFVFL